MIESLQRRYAALETFGCGGGVIAWPAL